MTRNAPPVAPASYTVLVVQPDSFDPFAPDALGALREAYAWIVNPSLIGNGELIYRSAHFNALVAMIKNALDAGQVQS